MLVTFEKAKLQHEISLAFGGLTWCGLVSPFAIDCAVGQIDTLRLDLTMTGLSSPDQSIWRLRGTLDATGRNGC